jgi:hypothetical protein
MTFCTALISHGGTTLSRRTLLHVVEITLWTRSSRRVALFDGAIDGRPRCKGIVSATWKDVFCRCVCFCKHIVNLMFAIFARGDYFLLIASKRF